MTTLVEKARVDASPLFVYYVDLKKAFDSVQHDLLWSKLGTVGVSCQIIVVLRSMYIKGTARVKINS